MNLLCQKEVREGPRVSPALHMELWCCVEEAAGTDRSLMFIDSVIGSFLGAACCVLFWEASGGQLLWLCGCRVSLLPWVLWKPEERTACYFPPPTQVKQAAILDMSNFTLCHFSFIQLKIHWSERTFLCHLVGSVLLPAGFTENRTVSTY